MLSRVADSLYWTSRYLERAEQIARVVDVNLGLTADRAPIDAARHWGRLLGSLPPPPPLDAGPAAEDGGATVDLANRASIAACVGAARENARQVREEIASEMWEELNRLYLTVRRVDGPSPEWSSGTHDFLGTVIGGVHMFRGVTDATMARGEGWHFMEAGRYVERASATAALLDVQSRECPWSADQPPTASEHLEWVGLLRACCAFEAYCRRYTADVRPDRIAAFLVLDRDCPRSLRFAAGRIHGSVTALSSLTGHVDGRADRLAGRLLASLEYAQAAEILADLPGCLQNVVQQTALINEAVHHQYVTYPIQPVPTAWVEA